MTMLKRRSAIMLIGALGCLFASHALIAQTATKPASQAGAAAKGPRPEQFKYPPLDFKPPKASEFRTVLSNGLVVYIAEDHEIPWFEASILSPVIAGGGGAMGRGRGAEMDDWPQRGGGGGGGSRSFLEPPDKLGLQALTGAIVRSGGTTTMTAEQMNERMDFLAGTVTATGLAIHIRHVDEGLRIWMDLLNAPAFPEDRLQREKQGMMPGIRNRNRNISTVASRTFQRLVYGDASPIVAEPTEATINAITRDDLVAWHKKYWGSNNAILVVAGDFKKADMLQKLEATFGKWRTAEKAVPPWPKAEQTTKAACTWCSPRG
jgi:zinc protease